MAKKKSPTATVIAKQLATVQLISRHMRTYGLGSRVKKQLLKVLGHDRDKQSPLVALFNSSTPGEYRDTVGEILELLGHLYRFCGSNHVPELFDAKAAADLLERLAIHLSIVSPEPKVTGTNATEPLTKSDAERDLQRVAQAVGDDTAGKVMAIAQRTDLSADEKMAQIVRLDRRYAGKDSNDWATLLGITSAAVRVTKTWKVTQAAKKSDG